MKDDIGMDMTGYIGEHTEGKFPDDALVFISTPASDGIHYLEKIAAISASRRWEPCRRTC